MHLNQDKQQQDISRQTNGDSMLMPDSSAHIARLESKLNRLKKNDPNKITGKDLISSMNQFKQIYMSDYFRNNNMKETSTNSITSYDESSENAIIVETIHKSYLEKKLLPEQPISTEEILNLVENDWLNKKSDESSDDNIQKS